MFCEPGLDCVLLLSDVVVFCHDWKHECCVCLSTICLDCCGVQDFFEVRCGVCSAKSMVLFCKCLKVWVRRVRVCMLVEDGFEEFLPELLFLSDISFCLVILVFCVMGVGEVALDMEDVV